jgi:uncharacterized protein YbjT (DUF2867 family)
MKVLVVGATGFIGSRLVAALDARGHKVLRGVRRPQGARDVAADFTRDRDERAWLPRLTGVEVVVNAVGILRESPGSSFAALHEEGPRALFRAAVAAGVGKVVQLSALGADDAARSRYHVSKRNADRLLATLPIRWVIVQPSLVFGAGGASAALFSRMAALPLVPLPGEGGQRVQPIHVDDLVAALVGVIEQDICDGERLVAAGPRPLALREWLATLRQQLGLGCARFVSVPMPLVRFAARYGPSQSLLDEDSLGMLERGNEGSPARLSAVLGRAPRAPEDFVPREQAALWATQAQLGWLLPLLRASVAFLWLATAAVSFGLYPIQDSYALLARVGLTGTMATFALFGAAMLDLALGLGVLWLRRRHWLWRAQIALVVGYSAIIAVWLPELWLHPFGPLTKNVPFVAALVLLHELDPGDA